MPIKKDRQMKIAIKFYQSGLSRREAACKAGISLNGLRYRMKIEHIKARSQREGREKFFIKRRNRLFSTEKLKILYLHKKKSLREIARMFGVTHAFIKKCLVEKGVNTRTQGDPAVEESKKHKGSQNGNWKGGKFKTPAGYIRALYKGHHRADNQGYVTRSILVWEKANKKKLPDGWIIHHKNKIKDDDRIENLIAMPDKKHRELPRRS